MNIKIILPAVIIGSTAASFAATVPPEIHARYMSLHSVMKTLNFAKFEGFFAKDFVNVDPSGKSADRKEFLAGVKPLFAANKSATVTEKFLSSKKHDGMVDVGTNLVVNLKGAGGTTVVHEVCVDTWKMVNKQWVMVKTVDSKFDVTMPKTKKGKVQGKG